MTDLTIHLIETVKDYCFCRQISAFMEKQNRSFERL